MKIHCTCGKPGHGARLRPTISMPRLMSGSELLTAINKELREHGRPSLAAVGTTEYYHDLAALHKAQAEIAQRDK